MKLFSPHVKVCIKQKQVKNDFDNYFQTRHELPKVDQIIHTSTKSFCEFKLKTLEGANCNYPIGKIALTSLNLLH